MLRRRRAQDLAIVAAVVALGAVALTDALRDGTTEEARDGRAATAATTDEVRRRRRRPRRHRPVKHRPPRTDEDEASVPDCRAGPRRVSSPSPPPAAASFGPSTSARAECLKSPAGDELRALRPRVGTRVAYSVHDDWGSSKRHFSILDLEHPRASFGDYLGDWDPTAWSPDGSTLAWCGGRSPGSSSRADSGRSVLTSARERTTRAARWRP